MNYKMNSKTHWHVIIKHLKDKERMAENGPDLMKYMNIDIQEAHEL